MNKFIEEQLKKVRVADLSHFDKETNTYHIPKTTESKYEVDSCYLIRLDDNLLSPFCNQTLITNWNKGSVPNSKYMKVDVSKVVGKMIYVNCIGYDNDKKVDTNYNWSGWLPTQQIKQIEKL